MICCFRDICRTNSHQNQLIQEIGFLHDTGLAVLPICAGISIEKPHYDASIDNAAVMLQCLFKLCTRCLGISHVHFTATLNEWVSACGDHLRTFEGTKIKEASLAKTIYHWAGGTTRRHHGDQHTFSHVLIRGDEKSDP